MIERNRTWSTVFTVLVFSLGLFLTGCAAGHPSAGTVQITSANPGLTAGASAQLQAIDTTLLSGVSDITTKASWTSSNPAVATVTSSGLLIGNTAGSAIITAAYDEATGSLAVAIGSPSITGLTVAPANTSVVAGASEQYTAMGTFANHTTADVTSSTKWSVTPANVATITSSGLLTATASGSYVVTAVSGSQTMNQTATAAGTVTGALLTSIAITPAKASIAGGGTQQFKATGTYNNTSTADISSSVSWSSSNTSLLTVTSTGLGTAHGNNPTSTVQLTATSGTVTAMVPVTITAGAAMTALVVEPTSSSIANGSAEQHTATAYFSDGSQQDVTNEVTWSSVDVSTVSNARSNDRHAQDTSAPVVTFAPGGVDIAAATGTAMLQASLGSLQSTSTVIVTPATIASLGVLATDTLIPAGSTQQVQLIGVFSDGSIQDLSLSANWTSANPNIATITSAGLATAISPGKVVFNAGFGGLTASSTGFEVLPTDLIDISLSVPRPANLLGLPQQLQIMGTYADGSSHDLTKLSVFKSEDPSLFSIDAAGVAIGLAQGTTQVSATVSGLTAIQTVSIFTSPIASMQVLPVATKIPLGTQFPFTASALLTSGTAVDVTAASVWTSADPSVLTVNSEGVAKTGKLGKTTISASVLGATGVSQTVEVTNAKLVKLILNKGATVLAPTVIAAGTGEQLTAVGFFSDGSQEEVSQDANWSTGDSTIATVDSTGIIRGVAPGQTTASISLLGMSATTQVIVTNATLVSTALSPGNIELPLGIYRQYALTGTFSDGTTEDLTFDAVFQAPTPSIAGLTPQGIVSGDSVGIGQITAQYGYFSASTPVQVTGATLTGITLTPTRNSAIGSAIRVGNAQGYLATGTFSDGYTQDLADNVVFSSSNLDVARILQVGLALATDVGTTQISATVRGFTASANLQVFSNVLTSLSVGPANPTIAAGGSQQLSATGIYADGSTDDLTSAVTWTSSNPAIVVVSSTGLATAAAGASGSVLVTAQYGGQNASFTVSVGSGGGGTTPSATLTGITVTPTSSHIAKGTTEQLTATGAYSDGSSQNLTASVVWTSTQPATAVVSDTGLVTAVAPGLVSVQASSGSFMSSSIVNVSAATLQSLAISPSGASFGVGASQQFTLTGTFTDGSTQNLSSSATWTSSNTAVASISSTGLATGASAGPVQFTASYQGQSVTSSVDTVTAATLVSLSVSPSNVSVAKGTSQQLTVTGTYSDGTTRDLTQSSTYSSSNPAVLGATSGGLITGAGTGSATVTITSGGITFTTQPVNVTPATLVSIAVTPMNPSLAAGTMQQFTAIGTFSDGTTEDLSSQAVWSSSNPQVATIDAHGVATSIAVGSVTISAAFNGTTGTTGTVQVTPATLTGLVLSPTSVQIAKGTTQQFTATGVFTDGSSQNLTSQVTWSSSNGAVAGIDANGLATGTGVGSAQVTAASMGKSASTSSFTVTAATLVSLSFDPADPTVASGTSAQIEVIGTYSDGTTQELTSGATLSSSNTSVATTSSDGTVNGLAPGTSTITVQAGGQTSSFNISVSAAVLTSIAITPADPSAIPIGSTEQFTATGTFSDGTMQNISSSASWTSSNNSVATVSSDGLATGVALGSVTLSASFDGQTATTPAFPVTPATIASITVSPQSPSVVVGNTQQFTATANYTDNSTQDVTGTVTWASSNSPVASISASGLASTTAAGSTGITATLNTLSGSSTLTVTTAPEPTLQQVVVTPASGNSITAGSTKQFTATGIYSNGTMQNLTTQATWTSSDVMIATVNSSGLATGVAAGSVTVQASFNGTSGSAPLTVNAAAVTLQSIAVTPATATIATDGTEQYTATGTYSDGTTQNLTTQVTWTSSNNAEAMINASGLATGVVPGTVSITAQLGSTSGAASLTVTATAPTLSSIAVTPASATISINGTQQFTATGTYSDGSSQNLTTQVTWNSSSASTATINSSGLATGVAAGSSTIQAALNGTTGTAMLTVSAPGATLQSIAVTPATASILAQGTQQFTATGTYSDGSSQNLTTQVTWNSSSASTATINSSGLATGVAAGSSTIQAALNGTMGTATLTVTVPAATLQSITVTPSVVSIAPAGTEQFAATGHYSDGSTQNLTSQVTWSSSNTLTAMISASGLATGVVPGNVTISAVLGGSAGTASLTVTATPATLQSIAVTPASASILVGGTQQYTATGTYSDGSTQNLTTQVTWSSSATGTATINSSGLATGVAAGSSTIQAALNGTSGTAALTVTNPPATLQSIAVTPASAMIANSATQQYAATGNYSDGSTQDLTSQVTWSSSVPTIATINSTGLATGVAAGNTQISAAFSSQTGTASLMVSAAPLNSIAVTPATATVAAGTGQQYKAVGTFADGSTQDLTTMVNWSSSDTMEATINTSGLASTTATGTVTITAQSGSVSGTATLTISTATPTGLQITPASVSGLPAGDVQQLMATATFSDGSSQNVTSSVTYTSSNPSVATVSSSGLLTAVGPGSTTITGTLGGSTATVPVTISNATLTSITVTPNDPSIPAGESQQLTATGTYSDGSTQNLTNTVTWTSSDPSGVSVSSTGNVMVMTAENVTITATHAGVSGTDSITGTAAVVTGISVSPASATIAVGETQQFAATATYSDGSQQTATASAHWSVSDPTKASIANGSGAGLLTANAAGSVNALATINGVSGSASVTITAATLSSLTINPSLVNPLPAGTTKQLSVTAAYSDGSSADVTNQVTWTTGQASTAYVDTTGLLHAVASGVTTIDAHLSGVDGTAAVTVGNATLTSIAITPAAPTLALGQTVQMTATGTYSDGSMENISSQVQWGSAAPAVATISSSGLVTTLTTGTSTLTATLNGTSQSTLLTVTSATLQSISVTSAQGSFALGQSLPLTATGFYSDGSTQNLTNSVTWTSSAPTVGLVSSTGSATGVSTGTFIARATSNGVVGSESILVTNAVLTSIAVTPNGQVVVDLQGTTVQFTATGTFSNGTTQNLTNSVHWATTGIVVGSISQAGVFSPTGAGVGTVTATSGSITGSAQLTVVAAPLL